MDRSTRFFIHFLSLEKNNETDRHAESCHVSVKWTEHHHHAIPFRMNVILDFIAEIRNTFQWQAVQHDCQGSSTISKRCCARHHNHHQQDGREGTTTTCNRSNFHADCLLLLTIRVLFNIQFVCLIMIIIIPLTLLWTVLSNVSASQEPHGYRCSRRMSVVGSREKKRQKV